MPQPWRDADLASPADHAACRAMLREGSRTFFAASLLLPPAVRTPATALYAFCRLADDVVDLDGGGTRGIADLKARLAAAYERRPQASPVDRAFADVVADHAVPRALPALLFEGFAWDAAGRRYESLEELCDYAARVAGTVGAMMAILMGVREPDAVARACDLGIAMQLSNIARDVGEDARAGRVYLPLAWLREAGIEPDGFLRAPVFTPALGGVVERLLAEAERLYGQAEAGIDRLPPRCRPGIWAARLLYAEIGREIARAGFDSVGARAVVPTPRKLGLLARATLRAGQPGEAVPPAPLSAALPLVDAVAAVPGWGAPERAAWWRLDRRLVWTIELFERLARRDRLGRSASGA